MAYNLPVPPDRVMQELFISGQPPPPPQTPSSAALSPQDNASLHAALITNLQTNAASGKSILRVFMFNLYAQYGFQTQQYMDLFDATAAYYLFLAQARDMNAIGKAVEESVSCEMPLLVQSYPELGQMLNQQQQHDLQQLDGLRATIANRMQQSYTPPSQSGYPINMGHSGNFGGNQGGFGFNGRHIPQQQMSGGMGSRQFPTAGMVNNASRSMPGGQRATNRPSTGGRHGKNQPVQTVPEVPKVSPLPKGSFNTTSPNVEDGAIGYQALTIDDVKFTKHFKLAHVESQSLISRTVGDYKEYALINKNQEIMMDYDNHENDSNMIKLSRSVIDGPTIEDKADWHKLKESKDVSIKDKLTSLDNNIDDRIVLSDVVAGLSIPHGLVMAEQYLSQSKLKRINERVVEVTSDVMRPLVASVSDMIVLAELTDVNTLTALIDRFSSISGRIDVRLWYIIHDRLTKVFNRRLKAGVAASFKIDSIVDDYGDAVEALSQSQTVVNVDRFKDRTYKAFSNVLRVSDFKDTIDGGKDDDSQALVERFSVMSLPWSSKDIDLSFEEYSLMSDSIDESMYSACLSMVHRADEDSTISRAFMTTADNVWFELHTADIHKDTVVISSINMG